MRVEYDFDEIIAFADKLRNFTLYEEYMKKAAREISKALLNHMKSYTPVDEYDLIRGWDGNNFIVTKKDNGFEVLIVNTNEYALYVNDGHKAYNGYGGPYKIRRRIQVRSPHKWQKGDATYYVFGHFFVERGIVKLTDTKQIEAIILNELRKWWEECLNG